VHASIWTFAGDPRVLAQRYDALATDVPPDAMRLHLCLRTPSGLLLVDTCPDRETFVAFSTSEGFRALRRRHGLPEPAQLEDYPVHAAFLAGRRIGAELPG
jgi:hypothetical protein